MYLNFERRINIGKKRNIYPYEQYHKYINGVLYKKCVYHEEYFPNEDPWFECTNEFFYINPKNKSDGLCPACIKCSRLKSRQWQIDNPERYKETCYKKNRNPNPKTKETWKKNAKRQRKNGYRREWLLKNKDKILIYNLKRMNKKHNITNKEWESCLKYFNYSCAYCGTTLEEHLEKFKERLHKEHVNPNGSNELDNCVPSCKFCNSSKYYYTLEEWYNKKNIIFSQERYNKIIRWITTDYKQFKRNK